MRARTKFAIGLMSITVVLSLALFGGLELYKDQQIDDTRQAINETASLAVDQIAAELQQRRDNVGYAASRPQARQFDRAGAYIGSFLNNSRFYAAQVIRANGTVVEFRGDIRERTRERVVGSDVSSETHVQKALDGRTYVSDVEYVPRVDRHIVIISAPIFDDEQRIKGVFAAALYLNENTLFGAVRPLQTSKQSIRITDGSAVLVPEAQRFQQRITGSATVPRTGWRVTVSRDASGLLRELRWLAIAQGVGLLTLLSLVVVFGYWQYATNLQQAERLLDAFDRLREGEFDHELSFTGADEWTRISEGFTEMVGELQERERRLSILNRVLRHNLRNDVGIIIGQAQIIPESDGPRRERAVEKIIQKGEQLVRHSETARRMEEAIEDAAQRRRAMDVVPVIENVVTECQETYPDATIRTDLPDERRVVAIDSLTHAVRNVVENAIEHNDGDEPVVDVEVVDADDDRTTIAVTDDGPGIPAHERQIFAEGRNETALEHSSGVGLWFAYWVVEKSGGTIRFDEGMAGGTRVELELDSAPSDASPDDVVDTSPAPATPRNESRQ
jgi:signal transduction histidine kinase